MEAENMHLDVMQTNEMDLVNKSLTPPDGESCYVSNNGFHSGSSETSCSWRNNFLNLFCGVYAEILVILAVTAVFTEVIHGPVPLYHIHVYIYLYLLGLSIIIFIWSCMSSIIQKLNGEDKDQKYEPEIWKKNYSYLNFARCFQFGLVVCGLVTFFCSCLQFLTVLMSTEKCVSTLTTALFIIHSPFIFLQLAFLLMNVHKLSKILGCFHNIAIMHLVATNAALLCKTILWESSKDWQDALHLKHNSSLRWGQREINISVHSLEFANGSKNKGPQLPKHGVHFTSNCWWRVPDDEASEDILSVELCLQNSPVGMLWEQTSEILYSVKVQYYLIVMLILYILWETKKFHYKNFQCLPLQYAKEQNTWYCFVSSKSFFLGCIIFIGSIIVVLMHKITGGIDFIIIMSLLYVVLGCAICASLYGLLHIKSSSTVVPLLNRNFANLYHRLGMCFVYAFGICNVFSGCLSENKYGLLLLFHAFFMILHVVIQYIFMNQVSTLLVQSFVRRSKILVFLVLCNGSLWILESFLFWSNSETDIQLEIYGVIAWPVIKRVIIPSLAFYRLYSAVMLLEAWKFSPVQPSKAGFE